MSRDYAVIRPAGAHLALARLLLTAVLLVAGCAGSGSTAQEISPLPSMSILPLLPTPAPTMTPPEVGFIGRALKVNTYGGEAGVNLLVTPMHAIGRIQRLPLYNEYGAIYPSMEKFYIAVQLLVENIGSVPWRRGWKHKQEGPSFMVFPEDPNVDARFKRPRNIGCSAMDGLAPLWWEKHPVLPQRLDPGQSVKSWLTFCVKWADWSNPRLELRDVAGDYVFATDCVFGCPIWRFSLE